MTTKLASDTFLPTGGLDTNHSSNRLSPAAHPNGNLPSIFSPLSNGSPPSTLAPSIPNDFSPPSSGHPPPSSQQRYGSSLSPIRHIGRPQPAPYQSNPPDVNGAVFLYRSVSADATTSPPAHAPNHLVQRLAQQNALIREAWENEKAALLRENQTLKERIQRLEGENATLRSVAAQQGVHAPDIMSPLPSQHGCSPDASTESGPIGHSPSQRTSHQGIAPVADPTSLPPGLTGASRRPHYLSPPGSSRTSPSGQSESSPFVPLDPRMQPQTQNPKDFLARTTKDKDESVPVIDVQELDPKLEGIPLKATAVQKPTFDGSSKSSPATSPPAAADAGHAEPRQPLKRLSSKDQTIQAMQAEESRRLTMHAGHTPNHSLSLFPTMSVADGSTGGATQDDDTAPSQGAPSAPPEQAEETAQHEAPDETAGQTENAEHGQSKDQLHVHEADEPEERLEPTDDVRLKGPLMVKNIPAQDEIFWNQVNKKLEPISQGQDALPAVMRSSHSEADAASPSDTQGLDRPQGRAVAPFGGDATYDHQPPAGVEGAEEEVSGEKGVEGDVPLKLKTTTNFGAPFGVA